MMPTTHSVKITLPRHVLCTPSTELKAALAQLLAALATAFGCSPELRAELDVPEGSGPVTTVQVWLESGSTPNPVAGVNVGAGI